MLANTFLKNNGCRATRARRLRDIASLLRDLNDPQTIQKYIGVSCSEMGKRLGEVHPNGHGGKPFHRSTVSHYNQRDYAMTRDTEFAYEKVLQAEVLKDTDNRMTISIKVFKNHWRITPRLVCKTCGAPFDFKRIDQTLCQECKQK